MRLIDGDARFNNIIIGVYVDEQVHDIVCHIYAIVGNARKFEIEKRMCVLYN